MSSSRSAAWIAKDKRLRAQFNISHDEWEQVLAFQNGLCALCKEYLTKSGPRKGLPKLLHTDHDHKTGQTRGILCVGCNRKIPTWMTVEWLRKVLYYLENPTVSQALGEDRFGRKGRVTNKRPKARRKTTRKPATRTRRK